MGQTNCLRLLIFLLLIGGCYLLIAPMLPKFFWVPEVGYLLEKAFLFSSVALASHVAAIIFIAFISLTWLPYRPCLALFLMLVTGALVGVMTIGDQLTKEQVLSIYKQNGWEWSATSPTRHLWSASEAQPQSVWLNTNKVSQIFKNLLPNQMISSRFYMCWVLIY